MSLLPFTQFLFLKLFPTPIASAVTLCVKCCTRVTFSDNAPGDGDRVEKTNIASAFTEFLLKEVRARSPLGQRLWADTMSESSFPEHAVDCTSQPPLQWDVVLQVRQSVSGGNMCVTSRPRVLRGGGCVFSALCFSLYWMDADNTKGSQDENKAKDGRHLAPQFTLWNKAISSPGMLALDCFMFNNNQNNFYCVWVTKMCLLICYSSCSLHRGPLQSQSACSVVISGLKTFLCCCPEGTVILKCLKLNW